MSPRHEKWSKWKPKWTLSGSGPHVGNSPMPEKRSIVETHVDTLGPKLKVKRSAFQHLANKKYGWCGWLRREKLVWRESTLSTEWPDPTNGLFTCDNKLTWLVTWLRPLIWKTCLRSIVLTLATLS